MEIAIDLISLNQKPVIHIVDREMGFPNGILIAKNHHKAYGIIVLIISHPSIADSLK